MSSRQSPLPPPPQSPLIHLGMDRLKLQLQLEERLRKASEELLDVYKNSRQWKQVTQMAQTLSFNAERITCIQDCIDSLNRSTVFEIPPPASSENRSPLTPSSSSSSPGAVSERAQLPPSPSDNKSIMVEDPYDEFISVKPAVEKSSDTPGMPPSWEIKSKKHTKGETVLRTSGDVSLLFSNIFKSDHSKGHSLLKDGVIDSPDAIRDIITACLDSPTDDKNLMLLQSFLTPSINNFSSLLSDSETPTKSLVDTAIEEEEENVPSLEEFPNDISIQTEASIKADQSNEPIKLALPEPHNDSLMSEPTLDSNDQFDAHDEDHQSDSNTDHSCTEQNDTTAPDYVDEETSTINDDEREEETMTTPDNAIPIETLIKNEEMNTEKEVPVGKASNNDGENSPEEEPITEDSTKLPGKDPICEDSTKLPEVEPDKLPEVEPSTEDSTKLPEEEPITEDSTKLPEKDPICEDSTKLPEMDPICEDSTKLPEVEPDKLPEVEPITEDSTKLPEVEPITEDNDKLMKAAESTGNTKAKQSPSKHGIKITNASQMFIQFQSINEIDDSSEPSETPPIPLVSDDDVTDTPTDNLTDTPTDLTSSDVFSRSGEISEDVESGEKSKNMADELKQNPSNSTFFVESSSTKSQVSPKIQMRNKSRSVFYPRSSPSPPPDQDKAKLRTKLKRSFKRTNKIKKDLSTSEEPQVSLMAPKLATEWDPTCILEELYSDCRPVAPQSCGNEDNCRYAGYLDKLPVNQSKPAVMKGWKHRYFRVTRGSLFYYEDNKNQKAISFVRLTDAKITLHIDSLKVEIVEKNGNFIFLRAETKEDAVAFHRALQLECVHPTLTHRLSLSPSRTTPTIIIDLGSCSVRAGLISDDNDYPQLFFPNVCAISDDKVIASGHDSLLPSIRGISKLVYPRRHRSRMDSTISVRECFMAIIEYVCKKLNVKPENCNMLASVSSIMPEMEQQILAEVVLEMLGFQGLLIQEQTTLSLYSYNCTTGVSVSVGDSISVVPIIDGYKVEGADQHIPIGGMNISENLSKLASSKDIRYFSDTEMYIIRHVKESLCFVSQDYFQDSDKCEESPHEYMRAIDVDRFQLPDHKKLIALDLSLFKAPEGLFQPAIWGKDVSGIHEMIHRSIEQCPIDMKRDMCRHIYLSGGTTLMTGFPERLKSELSKLLPRIEIVVNADESRYHAAYLGACILASLNTFQKSLVTQDDWISEGFDAFRKNSS